MKRLIVSYAFAPSAVAPLAGAWIETNQTTTWQLSGRVAPLAGAWIETPP